MSYEAQHTRALAQVSAKGAAISFVGTASTVSGYAVGLGGARSYRGGTTIQTEDPKLFFVPSTLGDEPAVNATCTWNGTAYVVASDVNSVSPDGPAIAVYVTLGR